MPKNQVAPPFESTSLLGQAQHRSNLRHHKAGSSDRAAEHWECPRSQSEDTSTAAGKSLVGSWSAGQQNILEISWLCWLGNFTIFRYL